MVIVLEAVRVFAIAAVAGAAAGLDIGGLPRLGAERAQDGGGVERAGPDLNVIGLKNGAALLAPIAVQGQDQILEGERLGRGGQIGLGRGWKKDGGP